MTLSFDDVSLLLLLLVIFLYFIYLIKIKIKNYRSRRDAVLLYSFDAPFELGVLAETKPSFEEDGALEMFFDGERVSDPFVFSCQLKNHREFPINDYQGLCPLVLEFSTETRFLDAYLDGAEAEHKDIVIEVDQDKVVVNFNTMLPGKQIQLKCICDGEVAVPQIGFGNKGSNEALMAKRQIHQEDNQAANNILIGGIGLAAIHSSLLYCIDGSSILTQAKTLSAEWVKNPDIPSSIKGFIISGFSVNLLFLFFISFFIFIFFYLFLLMLLRKIYISYMALRRNRTNQSAS